MPNHVYCIDIDSSREEVWQALADFGGASWIPKVVSTEAVSDDQSGVGAEQRIKHLILPSHSKRVMSWSDAQRVEVRYVGLPEQIASMSENWWLADQKGLIRVTVDQHYELNLGEAIMNIVPFVQDALKQDLFEALAGLRHYVETGDPTTSDFIQMAATELREGYTSTIRPA